MGAAEQMTTQMLWGPIITWEAQKTLLTPGMGRSAPAMAPILGVKQQIEDLFLSNFAFHREWVFYQGEKMPIGHT